VSGAEESVGEVLSTRDEVRGLLVLFGLVTGVGAVFEQRLATVDGTLLRLVSLVGAVAAGGVVIAAVKGAGGRKPLHRHEGVAVAPVGLMVPVVAALIAVVTHCQIEMTGITAGAGMWVLLLLAVCAGAGLAGQRARLGSSGTIRGRIGPAVMLGAAVIPLLTLVGKVGYWEIHLREATRIVRPVSESMDRAAALAGGRPYRGDSIEALARDLSVMTGRPVAASPQGVTTGLEGLRMQAIDLASRELLKARNAGPWDFQTARALSRLRLILAMTEESPAKVQELAPLAEAVIHSHMDATGETTAGWAWIATMRRTVYERTRHTVDGRGAVDAFAKAAALSPGEPLYRLEAARLEASLGNGTAAAAWAGDALRVNENLRLDPVRQLAGRDLEEARRLAGGGKPSVDR
jgi:hypothetical protein